MEKKVIIIGTGGHAKVITDIILENQDHVEGFFSKECKETEYMGFPILGKEAEYERYPDCEFIIAIGNAGVREEIADRMPKAAWYTAIHPSAIVSKLDTWIGEGTVIGPGAIVNAGARVGKHCIINSGSIVEHENCLEDYVHIAVGAKLGGDVHIGKKTWIGIGAVVKNGVSVSGDIMVGAGAVVVRDIEGQGTYIGIPAKEYRSRIN